MFRILLLILLGFIVWGIIRFTFFAWRFFRLFSVNHDSLKNPKVDSEKLVECATCHTFIPAIKAIQYKDAYYCCQEHALEK